MPSGNKQWLGAVRQQAITWSSVDLDLCRRMASPGHNELIQWCDGHISVNWVRWWLGTKWWMKGWALGKGWDWWTLQSMYPCLQQGRISATCVISMLRNYTCKYKYLFVFAKIDRWPGMTHWGLNKNGCLRQMTFWNVFSRQKFSYNLFIQIYWSLYQINDSPWVNHRFYPYFSGVTLHNGCHGGS